MSNVITLRRRSLLGRLRYAPRIWRLVFTGARLSGRSVWDSNLAAVRLAWWNLRGCPRVERAR